MPNPVECFRTVRSTIDLKNKVNPKGLIFLGAISAASPGFTAAGGFLTGVLHELSKDHNPALMQALAIGGLGVLTAASVYSDVRALDSFDYSANWTSSAIHYASKRPFLSSLAGHIATCAMNTILPLAGGEATRHPGFVIPGEIASAIIMTSSSVALNNLLLRGKTEPFVKFVEKSGQFIGEKTGANRIRHFIGSRVKKGNASEKISTEQAFF